MVEKRPPQPESGEIPAKKPTTTAQRFGGFAVAHLAYSLLSSPVFFLLFSAEEEVLLWLVPLGMMALYYPLGRLTAWLEEWTSPQTGRERILAVVWPTLVAWSWVCVVLVSLAGEWGDLLIPVFGLSVLLAAPSSLFTLVFFSGLSRAGMMVSLGFTGLFAGILPPLFFALGSFRQASVKHNGEAET